MRHVQDFSEFFFVLRSYWRKPRRTHTTFGRCVLIVWAIKIQMAREFDLNLGHHTAVQLCTPWYVYILNLECVLSESTRSTAVCILVYTAVVVYSGTTDMGMRVGTSVTCDTKCSTGLTGNGGN